jgi:hypothetical protein
MPVSSAIAMKSVVELGLIDEVELLVVQRPA